MFGYIRVHKPELRLKEWEMYKSVYCTLCKKLGKNYGVVSRFTLSYDFTFLCMLNMALKDKEIEIQRKSCAFNPLKKCNYCKNSDMDFEFPAAAAMIMVYYKLLDNIQDEKGIKKLGYKLARPFFSKSHKKAATKFPEIEQIISSYVAEQSRVESEKRTDLDAAANPTATALAQLFEMCADDEFNRRALSRLGYCMGRYIYILDAAVDFESDLKYNKFNPLKNDTDYKKHAHTQLITCINESEKAFELIDICRFKNILGNIIYLGLDQTREKELI